MSDSAGIPGGAGAGAPRSTGAGGAAPRPPRRPPRPRGRRRRRQRLLRRLALGAVLLLLAGAGTGWWLYRKLDGNITADAAAAAELERYERERPAHAVSGAENILVIGTDSRAGEANGRYGRDEGTQRSDTTILLHLSADRRSATAVSIPRDLMTAVPSCRTPDGSRTAAQLAQFNWAFEWGGAACTIRTVEKLSGIRVDHHMVVDFGGFQRMVDAVGGVEVCLKQPMDDPEAKLRLPAGRRTLGGEQALGFVRARYSLGDGSDTERIARQQQFLGSLVKKVQSDGVLLNPARLYPLLDAATSSLTTDPGLASLRDLYDLVADIRDVPTGQVRFLTVPREPYRADPNRDELVEPDAARLFDRLRLDRPVRVVPPAPQDGTAAGGRTGTSPAPAPTPTPSSASVFTGTTAGRADCR